MVYKQYLKLGIVLIVFVTFVHSTAQHIPFYKGGQIKIENKQLYRNPFSGGFNNGQISKFDVNLDGNDDFIVFDKAIGRIMVYEYVNTGDYEYSDYYSQKFPKCKSYLKFADLNSDGLKDIFTLSNSFNLQIYLNTSKTGDTLFSHKPVGEYAPDFNSHFIYFRNAQDSVPGEPRLGYNLFGMGNFDIPYIGDADNDGDVDILTYDPINKIYTLYNDCRAEKGLSSDTFDFQVMDRCYGYFSETLTAAMDLNSNCTFSQKLKPRHDAGSASELLDIDDDGDKDLFITNGVYNHVTYFINGRKNYNTQYDTMLSYDTLFPSYDIRANQLFFPTMNIADFNDDGIVDFVLTPTQYNSNQTEDNIIFYKGYKNAQKLQFTKNAPNPFYNFNLDHGSYSSPAFIDMDRDGDKDLLIAAVTNLGHFNIPAECRIFYYNNIGTKTDPHFKISDSNFLNISTLGDSRIVLSAGDLNGDNIEDIIVGSSKGKIFYFQGSGTTGSILFNSVDSNLITPTSFLEYLSAPCLLDIDSNQLPDLAIGNSNGYINIYKNIGTIAAPQFQLYAEKAYKAISNIYRPDVNPPQFELLGYCSPYIGDIDGDGKIELIVASGSGYLNSYNIQDKNPITDSLVRIENLFWVKHGNDSMTPYFGSNLRIAVADLNDDDVKEIFVGNTDGGLSMLSATKIKQDISAKHPAIPVAQIYPNPAFNTLNIYQPQIPITQIRVLDITGRQLVYKNINSQYFTLDVSALVQGNYILLINTPVGVSSHKIQIIPQ